MELNKGSEAVENLKKDNEKDVASQNVVFAGNRTEPQPPNYVQRNAKVN